MCVGWEDWCFEPDDYAGNKSTTGKVVIPSIGNGTGQVGGGIQFSGDSDWFTVSLTAGRHYVFSFQGNSNDNANTVSCVDAAGNKVRADNLNYFWMDPPLNYNRDYYTVIPEKSGTYYLAVGGNFLGPHNWWMYDNSYFLSAREKLDDYGDYPESAQQVTLHQGREAFKGHNEELHDEDWFRVNFIAGKQYRIAVNNTQTHGLISLRDAQNNPVVNKDWLPPSSNIFFFTPSSSKTYYAVVTGASSYTFEIIEKAINDDYSSDKLTVGTLAIRQEQTGSIEIKGDHDWFKVSLVAGTRYYFLSPADATTLNSGVVLSLHNASGGQELLQTKDGSPYYYTPAQSGSYYLDVSAGEDSMTGIYKIAVVPDDYPDQLSTIEPAVIGDTVITIGRSEDFSGDHDWIPVQLTAGKSYAIHNLFDKDLYYHEAGTVVAGVITLETFMSLRYNQGQPVANSASQGRDFAFSIPTSGVYYLDASGPNAFDLWGNNLAFKIASYQDDYVDNIATQGHMALPDKQTVSVNGHIEVNGDHDWFQVTLTAGKQYLFSSKPTTGIQGGLQFPVLHLYDSAGNALSTGADDKQISFKASSSGNYFVDVSGWVDRISLATDYYLRNSATYKGAYTLTTTQKDDDYGNDRLTAGTFDLVGVDGVSTALQGRIEIKSDNDWVAVKLLVGRTYNFSLYGNAVRLALYDTKGLLINQSADSYTDSIEYTPTHSSTYFLNVDGQEGLNPDRYTLSALSYKDDYPGYVSNIKPLALGGWLSGNLNFKGDHDLIPFKAVADAHYNIKFAPSDNPFATRYDDVVLRDAAGSLMPRSDWHTLFNSQRYFEFTAPKSDIFYIDIGTVDRPDVVYGRGDTFYGIGINTYKDDYSADRLTTGQLVLASNALHFVTGSWDGFSVFGDFARPDADWFKVSLQAGKSYTVALTANQGALAVSNNLSVLDATGKVVKPAAFSDDSISFIAPRTGTYYLNAHITNISSLATLHSDDSIPYTLIGQQSVPIGTAKNEVMNGSDGGDLLYGRGGNDTLNGGKGGDILNGGTGKDVMIGGVGNDRYFVDDTGDSVKETSNSLTEKDTVFSTIAYTLPARVEYLVLSVDGLDKAVLGRGNQLDNTLIGQSTLSGKSTEILRGGAGEDTLINKNYGSKQMHLYGEAGNDKLTGYGHLVGGAGKDTYELKGDSNRVEIARGDSLPATFDVIKGFSLALDSTKANRLDLNSNHTAQDITAVNGKDTGAIHSHHISNGLISFDDLNTYIAPLAITADKIADAIKYLQTNITKPGDTVAFVAGHDTYVFQDGGSVDTLVQLVGVAAEGIHNTAVKGTILLV